MWLLCLSISSTCPLSRTVQWQKLMGQCIDDDIDAYSKCILCRKSFAAAGAGCSSCPTAGKCIGAENYHGSPININSSQQRSFYLRICLTGPEKAFSFFNCVKRMENRVLRRQRLQLIVRENLSHFSLKISCERCIAATRGRKEKSPFSQMFSQVRNFPFI